MGKSVMLRNRFFLRRQKRAGRAAWLFAFFLPAFAAQCQAAQCQAAGGAQAAGAQAAGAQAAGALSVAAEAAPPLPRKRKFIDSGVLRPNILPPKKHSADFPPFSDSVFVPKFFDSHERFERVDLSGVSHLRFLTAADFFPFNYADANGNLAGYNVDLARALCAELRLENICRIEAAPWAELLARLRAGAADALIAGLAPSAQNRAYLSFSRAYLRFPARFIGLAGGEIEKDSRAYLRQGYDFSEFLLLRGKSLRVGALSQTLHEKMLENYFAAKPAVAAAGGQAGNSEAAPARAPLMLRGFQWGGAEHYTAGGKNVLQLVSFPNMAAMAAALKLGQIDLAFGDGMSFSLLISGEAAAKSPAPPQAAAPQSAATQQTAAPHFVFLGGAYNGGGYLGQGMRIAVMQNNARLSAAFNYALQQLERKGKLAELYLRYFPIGFY